MFEGDDDEIEFNPDDVSSEDSLLYSHFSGPRLFVLNNAENLNIWGVLLEESDDSFLVGLPARMVQTEEGAVVVPYMPVPYTRLLKSAILSVSYTFEPYTELYMNYVEVKGSELYPEISEYIEEDTELESESAESTIITPSDITELSLSKDAEEGNEVQGMSDEELQQYLTNKHKNGELAIGSRKKQ